MKKFYISLLLILALSSLFWQGVGGGVMAQMCDPSVPVFNVNLTGNAGGSWLSPPVQRNGLCCSASGADVCVEFDIILDSASGGISFGIASGAIPPGALYYQVDCGPPTPVGGIICLSGIGPHHLTFCKPGGNTNTFEIQSIPKPALNGAHFVSQGCTAQLVVQGLVDTSITWTSIPSNPIYNGYLSCTQGCDSVTVTFNGGAMPSYVDYKVCGSVMGGCNAGNFCDTIRVNFVNDLAVNITPKNPVICFGGGGATVTAQPSGGLAPYNFLWSNGATTSSINVGAGTYIVTLTDSMHCSTANDTVTVTALSSAIAANAGPDQVLCVGARQTIALNGVITAATGGIWMGGSGNYNPSDTTLNAVYTPSASEITVGYAQLMLVTTGNSGCPADTDWISINMAPQPSPTLTGSLSVCELTTSTYTATNSSAVSYLWTVTGGTLLSSNNSNPITVQWNNAGSGSITLNASNSLCDTIITYPVTINPKPTPVINGPSSVCVPAISTFSLNNPGTNTHNWAVTGGAIIGSNTGSNITVLLTNPGTANISVTETNSFGCDSAVSISVILNPQPYPQVTGAFVVCEKTVSSYTASCNVLSGYLWTVTGGTLLSPNNSSTVNVQWNGSGSGSITLAATHAAGCDSTISYPVTINPKPTPIITGPSSVCVPATSIFSVPASGNNYSWSVSGGNIIGSSLGNSINVQWTNPGTANISVTETNSFGCDSAVSVSVILNPQPYPQVTGAFVVCEHTISSYTASCNVLAAYHWVITGGTLLSPNNSGTVNVQWNNAGNGSIMFTATHAAGCDSTITYPVTINPKPTPIITGPSSVCVPATSIFSVPASGNNYSWSVSGGNIIGSSLGNSINVQWTNPGTANISVTETNSFGCDSAVSVSAILNPQPYPQVTGAFIVCEHTVSSYTASCNVLAAYHWVITGGTLLSPNNSGTVNVQWNNAGSGSITFTATHAAGCDSTITYPVTINPKPTPLITGPSSVCIPSSSTFSVNASGNNYSWSVVGGNIIGSSSGNSINVQWTNPGTANVSVIETNSFGCDSTVAISVALSPYPTPVLTGRNKVCAQDTANYWVPNVAGHTYNWTVTGGSIVSFTVTNSIDVYWYTPGQGEVSVQEVSPSGCDSTVKQAVRINPKPAPTVTGPLSVCENQQFIYLTQNNGSYFNWMVNGGYIINISAAADSASIQWTNAGAAAITLMEIDTNGCINSTNVPVIVQPRPHPAIAGNHTGCVSQLKNNYSCGSQSGVSYLWSSNGGAITNGNGTANISIQWTTPGTFIITVTATNFSTGCDSSATIQVIVDTMPQPVITASNYNGCAPLGVYFSSSAQNPNYTYSWSFGDGHSSWGINPSHQFNNSGTYPVTLIVSNNTGCVDSVNSQVVVFPTPVAYFVEHVTSDVFYNTTPFTLQNLSTGANQYFWNFGDGDTSYDFQPTYMYPGPGTYTVTLIVTNMYGCKDTTQEMLEIKVPEDIYIPNAFSPNGDSRNDQFNISVKNISDLTFTIFDRWGQEIFTSKDKDFRWDGTFKGALVQEGVYVYELKATGYYGKQFERMGTVTVVR